MNWWYPIGIVLSVAVIYWSIQDERLLRDNPDEFLRRAMTGDVNGFYLTLQGVFSRVTRLAMAELIEVDDLEERRRRLEQRILTMKGRERVLDRVRWEVRFRGVAFLVFGLVLAGDWLGL